MEPITSWSEETVNKWLQGLDAPLHQYPVSEWHLSGLDLLQLTSHDLNRLGVSKIGHQELILEAVEKLCSLTYGIGGENLRSLTEKLRAVAHSLQMGIQSRWRTIGYDGQAATKLPVGILQNVVELITSAKGLFSLLNRYQLSQLCGYTASKNIFFHCKELSDIVHKEDTTVHEKEKDIISICRHLVVVCDEILNYSPEPLLTRTAQLESVDLVPVSPGESLGIEITSTCSINHYVTGSAAEPCSEAYLKILAGDEVVQVNDQIVVGWSKANLVKKLRENPSGVTLVLKKVPGSVRCKSVQPVQSGPSVRSVQQVEITYAQEEEDREETSDEEKKDSEDNPRHSLFERVAASVRSLSFRRAVQGPEGQQPPMGQEESELPSDRVEESDSSRLFLGIRRDRSPSPMRFGSIRSYSPQGVDKARASISSCPEMVGPTGNKEGKKSSTKGKTTALSRRRVSCRELDHPDCDGWLWKKRRESSVFIAQKWQRFWCVLKGPCLYWYNSPQDEKAEGLLNISSYTIEGAGEHRRKYVFQMSHRKFQNFFFAADHVNDMAKWIKCLIAAKERHKESTKSPDSEEECYSETESESESSPSPRRKNKKVLPNTMPRPKEKTKRLPLLNSSPEGSKGTGAPVDEMGRMLNNLKEGGVSLTGQEQPFTHDHFRKSFIRRCKNPIINEKVHTLRALQSTLKAKEAELQQINKLLDDPILSASKFRQWKEGNEELVKDIEKLAVLRASKAGDGAPVTDTPSEEVVLETVATETAATETDGAYRLSLSDGEELVDAEQSDVRLEMPQVSLKTDTSPVLEVSLGSLRDSINRQLNIASESGDSEEKYFFI
ncbi:connector enhancer of kinase suppressor of ras 1 [Pholidichthys leucotaenia]